jgi:hypothetical protein
MRYEFINMGDGIWYVINHRFNDTFMFIVKAEDIKLLRSTFGPESSNAKLDAAYKRIAANKLHDHIKEQNRIAFWKLQGELMGSIA